MRRGVLHSEPRDIPQLAEAIEDVRLGTRQQYESDWLYIEAEGAAEFAHGLGELPWLIDVLASENSDGTDAAAATPITVAKTDTTITVTNDSTTTASFFRVRAL